MFQTGWTLIDLPNLDSNLHTRGPSNGLIIVYDMQNVGVRHLMRPKIETLRNFFRYLQDGLPAKLEAMHIVNCVSFFDMVLTLIKPFMKSEIIQKVDIFYNRCDDKLSNEMFQYVNLKLWLQFRKIFLIIWLSHHFRCFSIAAPTTKNSIKNQVFPHLVCPPI